MRLLKTEFTSPGRFSICTTRCARLARTLTELINTRITSFVACLSSALTYVDMPCFRGFRIKQRKAPTNFVLRLRPPVCLSACNSAALTGQIFVKFDIETYKKICRENPNLVKTGQTFCYRRHEVSMKVLPSRKTISACQDSRGGIQIKRMRNSFTLQHINCLFCYVVIEAHVFTPVLFC